MNIKIIISEIAMCFEKSQQEISKRKTGPISKRKTCLGRMLKELLRWIGGPVILLMNYENWGKSHPR